MSTLTVEKLQRATQLQEQVDNIQAEINSLLFGDEGNGSVVTAPRRFVMPAATRVTTQPRTGKRQLSEEAIRAIREGQRRRWAGLPSKKQEKEAKRAAKLAAKAAAAAATAPVTAAPAAPVATGTETAPAAQTAVVNPPAATAAPTTETAPAVKPAKTGKLLAAA